MADAGLGRPPWWKVAIALCAIWNVVYATASAVTGEPVFILRSVIPSYFFIPVYAWLIWGLWVQKYSAWWVGLLACAPFALGGFSKAIAVLIHGNRATILPMETLLQVMGVCAIATNVLQGILLLAYREEFSPEYGGRLVTYAPAQRHYRIPNFPSFSRNFSIMNLLPS
jgi:hypothetical protein